VAVVAAPDDDTSRRARLPGPIRIAWIAVGVAGAIGHALGTAANHWPATDLITMGWLGFAALGVLLPSIDSIELPGGASVKFQEAVAAGEEGIADLEHALGEATELIADWLGTIAWLNTYLQRRDVDDDTALRSVFRYCLERMEDAKEWMGDADERSAFLCGGWIRPTAISSLCLATTFATSARRVFGSHLARG
jgi:hypothetical protein